MGNLVVVLSILLVPPLVALAIRRFWVAIAISTVTLSAILHAASWLEVGYPDPTFLVSIPTSLAAFFVWSLGITWLVHRGRTAKKDEPVHNQQLTSGRGDDNTLP